LKKFMLMSFFISIIQSVFNDNFIPLEKLERENTGE